MERVILIVLDSAGAGALPDAGDYGDAGADTLAHILNNGGLCVPHMADMGLGMLPGLSALGGVKAGAYGRMRERAPGKDTTTGHWEMAGVTLKKPFPTYPDGFPDDVIAEFERLIGRGTLGNKAASGTEILNELGEEHLRTGKPIVYTSADSVFQLAANEGIIPRDSLYDMCEKARALLQGEHAVGRVIARPFIGEKRGAFTRTAGRRDYSLPPPGETVLDLLKGEGYDVIGVGKIEDIFCHRGLTDSEHAAGNPACLDALDRFLALDFKGLCFVNLVDTDMIYGHRRDVSGYRAALEAFDRRLPEIMQRIREGDLLMITADHGCDPTFRGTDHTREHAPLLCWSPGMQKAVNLGERDTFADAAATISDYFHLNERFGARSFRDALEV